MAKLLKQSILENIPFWVLIAASIIMGTISFFMPPKGNIDPSVIKYSSWMFAQEALWTVFVAMKRGLDARIKHGKTSLTVGNIEGDKQETDSNEGED